MAIYRLMLSFFIVVFFFGCKAKSVAPAGNHMYDLAKPVLIKLPQTLSEISGIYYYSKDSSVFAIEDEHGILYKIFLNGKNEIRKWQFDKKRDFEDIVLKDSIFYVLVSNGDIETLKFATGDSIIREKFNFPDASKKKNEFESLYYDDTLQQIILLCKDCEDDKKKAITAWGYNISTQQYSPSVLTINVQPIAEKIGEQKMKFKPSATAINPVTNELYIISSISQLMIVTDRNGKFKEVFYLDPAIYKQAEGIAFTTAGDMIISNEWHETGLANILIIKNKMKSL